jgi:tRNA nucleotidyltransferase (CCA-adding enzyme)
MQLNLPQAISEIFRLVRDSGHEIYLVGGAVRDLLMNLGVKDWDFTTNATPEEIMKIFPHSFYDNSFGTVGVIIDDSKNPYEITTYRSEHGYSDSRRPDRVVWGKSLSMDLSRRDFTINAMAITPAGGEPDNYQLIDPHQGKKDLENKVIKAVGDPDARFKEDALRMMRAVRIASQIGFVIDDNTFKALCTNSALILNISQERIRDELFKILASDYVYDGLVLLKNAGLLERILPEVCSGFGVEQASPGRHHIYDVGTHCFLATKFCPSNDPLVKLATLLHDVGKPPTMKVLNNGTITFYNHEVVGAQIAYQIGQRLRLSKVDIKRLVTLVRWHQFTVDERQTDSAIRRFMRRVGKENLSDILSLRTGDRLGGGARETSWRLEKFKERLDQLSITPFTVSDMAVNGHDIMNHLGIKPGPVLGLVINKLFDEVMEDHTKNNGEYLLSQAQKIFADYLRTNSL